MKNKTRIVLIIALSFIVFFGVYNRAVASNDFKIDQNAPTYAKQFYQNCEGEKWFIEEVERLLNEQKETLNYATDSSYFDNIFSLAFTDNGSIAKIPKAISELKSLKHLFFSGNRINSIPNEVYTLTNIETFDFSKNNISTGISLNIGNFTKLKVLSLHTNTMSGTIPKEIFSSSKIKTIDLSNNKLTGTIPNEIGNQTSLVYFGASKNQLVGEIPSSVLNLLNLKALLLWGNKLGVNLINDFSTLIKLEILDLATNKFEGNLPKLPLSIIKFSIRENKITGEMRNDYSSLTNMEVFDINNNEISGKIPDIFSTMNDLLVSDLSDNKLVSYIPQSLLDKYENDNTDVLINKNYLTGYNALQLNKNADNFVDTATSLQNRMYLAPYIQVKANQKVDVYNLFEHRSVDLQSVYRNKEKLAVLGYECELTANNDALALTTKYNVLSINDLYEINFTARAIEIKMLKDIDKADALEFVLRIKYNDGSDYSQTIFKVTADKVQNPDPPVIPPTPPTPTPPSGGGPLITTETTTEEEITKDDNGLIEQSDKKGIHKPYLFGYKDGSVKADSNISREEAAVIIYRILDDRDKEDFIAKNNIFKDLNRDRWSYKEIAYLNEIKLIKGYPDGNFEAKNEITRAEFSTILYKYLDLKANQNLSFEDLRGHWAEDYINAIADEGLIKGYPDGSFKPNQKITRAEVVTVINKILKRTISDSTIDNIKNLYSDLNKTHWAYKNIIEASVEHKYEIKKEIEFWVE